MTGIDTNILVYAHREDAPFHVRAFQCIQSLAEGTAPWAIPWPCIHEFLAITTHPKIYSPPSPLSTALAQIDAWLESPSLILLGEAPGYWEISRQLIVSSHIQGPQIHDARIAGICIQHGVTELYTSDRDFSRFPPLRIRNPLVG